MYWPITVDFCNLIGKDFMIYTDADNRGQSSLSVSHNAGLSNNAFGAMSVWKRWKWQKISIVKVKVCDCI